MNARTNILALAALLLIPTFGYAKDPVVKPDPEGWSSEVNLLPEVKQIVKVSNQDHNWVRCPEKIGEVVYSAEDGVKVTVSGQNAYIKFQWTTNPETGEQVRPNDRTDIFVECGGEVYKILALPVGIESRTLILVQGKGKLMQQKISQATTDPETRVLEILRMVWRNELDEGWQVAKKNESLDLEPGLELNLIKEVRIEGEGMRVKEFLVENGGNARRIQEKEFLAPALSKSPLAIVFAAQEEKGDQNFLAEDGKGRLILVEHINEDFGLPLIREPKGN